MAETSILEAREDAGQCSSSYFMLAHQSSPPGARTTLEMHSQPYDIWPLI